MGNGKTTAVRTFEVDVPVSAPLEGEFNDWPANIQDPIYAALGAVAEREQLPLVIVHSRCDVDHDVAEGAPGRFYLHVVASEVVMADERTLTPGRVMKELPEDIRRLLN